MAAGSTAAGSVVASDNAKTISVETPGYYFVNTTTGSLCSLNTTNPTAKIEEKNSVPEVDKKQGTEAGNYADANLDLNIGDTVYYQIEVNVGKGSDKDIKLTDTLTAGLTLDQGSISVKDANGTVIANPNNTNYDITNKTEQGFIVTFKADFIGFLLPDPQNLVHCAL